MNISKISKLKPNEGILISFKTQQHSVDEVSNVYKHVTDAYPDQPVVCIPDDYEIKIQDIDNIIKYLEDYKEKINYENRN